MNDDFPPGVADGIVEHMNADHADAVLAIARVQGGAIDAAAARLLSITPRSLDIEVVQTGTTGATTVVFDPPIEPLETVRARLVEMTKAARAAMAGAERP